MTYSIYPIALCSGPRDLSQYTYGMNFGKMCVSMWYTWYILGSQPKTLVDTGAYSPDMQQLNTVEDGLAGMGLKPEDIEIVIVTHLHYDHIALAGLYKNARFIVQKKELDYALKPHPLDAICYDKDTFRNIDMDLIDGEKEVLPGLRVFHSPGHTPGGQSVEIEAVSGKVIIAGLCAEPETFGVSDEMKKRKWEASAPLIHQDVREAYDSILKIKSRGGRIIAMHDPVYQGKDGFLIK